MLSPQFVNAKDLRKAIGELNSTGLIDPKIKTVGVKKEVMVENFKKRMEGVPETEESKVAEATINFYNSIIEGTDPSPEEQKKQTVKKSVPRGPSNEKKAYDLMKAGAAEEAWTKLFGEYYEKRGVKDINFVKKRIAIYKNIAKKQLAKEGTPVAEEPVEEESVEEEKVTAKKVTAKKVTAKKVTAKKVTAKKEPVEEEPIDEEPIDEEVIEEEPIDEEVIEEEVIEEEEVESKE